MRPANVVTSVADVLAGAAIAGAFTSMQQWADIVLLSLSTACLYAGGIVFNDVFDAELDKVERPERAIPSGIISIKTAARLGALLLLAGFFLASFVSFASAALAMGITFFALLYNKISKHHPFFGPLNMGLCRGLNLLLGISVIPAALGEWYLLTIVPIVYIFSITMISRGEVHGGNKTNLYIAAGLYGLVTGIILYFIFMNKRWWALAFLLPFLWMIMKPLAKAVADPIGKNIGAAVKAGVISLILMDAAWAATFSTLYVALAIACLLPISMWLAKIFSVT
ncbi:MAG: polyprenyltransferase [Sphingobacteriaceae bacterium]|nr:MAG: polyprenyltransferase [Sphingobacteriaceae bacterium]